MLVKKWMSKPVITVTPDDNIGKATRLLYDNKIRALPVLEDGKLVGIVTDRDIKNVSVSEMSGLEDHERIYINTRTKVGFIMTEDPLTVSPNTTVDVVAKILLENRISHVPVMDNDELVGIITQLDIFSVLISFSSVEGKGVQIAIQLPDVPGAIKELASTIREFGGRIGSLLTSTPKEDPEKMNAYIKAYSLDLSKMDALIEALQKQGRLFYIASYGEEGDVDLNIIDKDY